MKIFKDNNDWNEKAIVGFVAFIIMCIIMIADLATGWYGYDLVINEFVYDSFVWVVLGCFGISGVEKFAKKMKYLGKHNIFDDLMIGGVLLTPPDPATYAYELTLPNDDGSAGQLLTTDGNGVLTWTTVTPGTGTVTSITPAADSGSGTAITGAGTLTFTGGTNVTTAVSGTTVTFNASGSGVTMTDGVDNRIMTASAAQSIQGEAYATFVNSGNISTLSLLSDQDTADLFSIATTTNGATTFTTVNDGIGLDANLDFNIDGTVEIATASGKNITLDSGASVYLEGGIIQAEYSTSGVRIRNASASASYYSQINVTGIDGARIHTLPNATGTLALTSDIPALSVPVTVGQGGTGLTTVGTNNILTGNGTSALTSESELRYYSDILSIGSSADSSTDYIKRNAGGSDIIGGDLSIHGGDTRPGIANNKNGGDLNLIGGLSTGTGASGKITFNTGWETVSGTGQLGPALHTEIAGTSVLNTFTIYEPNLGIADYFQVKVAAAGATTLATLDASGGQAASFTVDCDGLINLDAERNGIITFNDGGTQYGGLDAASSLSTFTLYEAAGASTADYFKISTATHGATTISTIDTAGHDADLTLDIDGTITIDSADAVINFDANGVDVARFDNVLGNNLHIYGNTDGSGKVKLYEDTDNGSNKITIQPPVSIASDKVIALPDLEGTVALVDSTARQVVSLRTDDAYVMYLGSVDRWYQANRVFSSIGTQSTLDGASVTDSVAITAASYIAIRACTVHSVVIAWYPTQTADIEFEILKVPLVDNSTSNVTFAQMTHTDHNASYTANTNYVKTFAITGGNTLTAGQGLALVARRTSGNATYMNGGQIYAEIEITG